MPYSSATADKFLKSLRGKVGANVFTLLEASRALKRPPSTVRHLLWLLTRKGTVRRIGRGLYGFAYAATPSVQLTDQGHRVHEFLGFQGIDFVVSGLDILLPYVHSPMRRYPSLVYVARGGLDLAVEVLQSHSITALRDPGREALRLGLDLAPENQLITILRPMSDRFAVSDHTATTERALVDLYYEVTRDQFPLGTAELMRIIYYTVSGPPLRYSKLVHYASRRGIRGELVTILRKLDWLKTIPRDYLRAPATRNRFTKRLPSFDEVILR